MKKKNHSFTVERDDEEIVLTGDFYIIYTTIELDLSSVKIEKNNESFNDLLLEEIKDAEDRVYEMEFETLISDKEKQEEDSLNRWEYLHDK
jgi:hypothetical protein